jgi:carbonic anhydrase
MKMLQRSYGRSLSLLSLAEILVAVGAAQLRSSRNADSARFFAYDYSKHGQDWVSGSCASRSRQSPINLTAEDLLTSSGMFQYKYLPMMEPVEVINNGHTLSIDLTGLSLGGILYDGTWYNLLNINVHSLSEHTWQDKHKPLELHLVHKRYDSDKLIIVAVALDCTYSLPALERLERRKERQALLKSDQEHLAQNMALEDPSSTTPTPGMSLPTGPQYMAPTVGEPNFNAALQAFLKVEPPAVGTTAYVPKDVFSPPNLNDLMQGANFYEYAGSLTAPPCSETAIWLVRTDVLMASDKQVAYLSDAIYRTTAEFGNYREVMPLSSRSVTIRQSMMEDLPENEPTPVPPGPPQHADREYKAMKWSMDAMDIAKKSVDYVKNLDMRLRLAAQAHADALDPRRDVPPGETTMMYSTTPPLGNHMMCPKEMEDTATSMARTLAEDANEVVAQAKTDIMDTARTVAFSAANEAAKMVATGDGNPNILANAVSTPAPFVAPLPAAVFQR